MLQNKKKNTYLSALTVLNNSNLYIKRRYYQIEDT